MTRLRRAGYLRMLLGLLVVAVWMFPVYWMLATSLKAAGDVFADPPDWFPAPLVVDSYETAVLDNPGVLRGLLNSTVIAAGTLALTLIVGAPAAYALARLRLRFAVLIALVLLLAQMLPTINLALPLFAIFSRLGLVDSYAGLILANTALTLPFAVIVLRPYFLSVPEELVDAARVDGCNRFGAFRRIALPLVRPGLVTVGALAFVMAWGEFVFGLTLATSEDMEPVTVVLNRFIGQFHTRWNDLMAVAVAAALPIIVVFAVLQRFVVSGLMAGATKE